MNTGSEWHAVITGLIYSKIVIILFNNSLSIMFFLFLGLFLLRERYFDEIHYFVFGLFVPVLLYKLFMLLGGFI